VAGGVPLEIFAGLAVVALLAGGLEKKLEIDCCFLLEGWDRPGILIHDVFSIFRSSSSPHRAFLQSRDFGRRDKW
jgi:hypothetical protein